MLIQCEAMRALEGLGSCPQRRPGPAEREPRPAPHGYRHATMYDSRTKLPGAGRPGGAAVLVGSSVPHGDPRAGPPPRAGIRGSRSRSTTHGPAGRSAWDSAKEVASKLLLDQPLPIEHVPRVSVLLPPERSDVHAPRAPSVPMCTRSRPSSSRGSTMSRTVPLSREAQAEAASPRAVEGVDDRHGRCPSPNSRRVRRRRSRGGGPEDPAIAEVPTLEELVAREASAAQAVPNRIWGEPAAGPVPEPARDTAREPTGVDPTACRGVEPPG